MPNRRRVGQILSIVALVSLGLLSANLAHATDTGGWPEDGRTGDATLIDNPRVRLHLKIDGQLVPLDQDFIDAHTAELPVLSQADTDEAQADLISFEQWIRCFTLGMSDDSYALYTHYWNNVAHDVRLKCGEGGRSGWGYKHIREGKEKLWQEELDTARSKGWISERQGVESWDDLMAAVTGVAITWPNYRGGNSHSNTSCGVVDVYFAEEHGVDMYSFRATAAWADDSDKLITSFPTLREVC